MAKEVDQKSGLWKDIVALLKEVTPIRPAPEIKPSTKIAKLRLSSMMRRALKHNWNEMIEHYETERELLTYDESEELATAEDVWLRIAKEDEE